MRRLLRCVCFLVIIGLLLSSAACAGYKPHVVRQLNGADEVKELAAEYQVITEDWENEYTHAPFLIYMPEKKQLLFVASDIKLQGLYSVSHDNGATWSPMRRPQVAPEEVGQFRLPTSVTYLGDGKIIVSGARSWVHQDF